jgi:hypothetical protein
MMLALAGCGPNEYQDSNAMTYTTSSGMIDDGGETPSVDQNYADQVGTILFVASPGDGKPQQLISRTNSITSAPTAEFLAREAIAARQRAPTDSNRVDPAAGDRGGRRCGRADIAAHGVRYHTGQHHTGQHLHSKLAHRKQVPMHLQPAIRQS